MGVASPNGVFCGRVYWVLPSEQSPRDSASPPSIVSLTAESRGDQFGVEIFGNFLDFTIDHLRPPSSGEFLLVVMKGLSRSVVRCLRWRAARLGRAQLTHLF